MPLRSGTLRRAFTLVELLLVMAIVGILASLLLPAVTSLRLSARQLVFGNNLRQIGASLLTYAGNDNGRTACLTTAEGGWYYSAAALLGRNDFATGTWTDEAVGRSIFHDPIDLSIHVRPGYNRRTYNVAMNGNTFWRSTGTGIPAGGAWWAGGWTVQPKPVGAMHRRLAAIAHPSELMLVGPGPNSGNYSIGSEGGYALRLASYDWLANSAGPWEFVRYAGKAPFAFVDGHVQAVRAGDFWNELQKDRFLGTSRFIDTGATNP